HLERPDARIGGERAHREVFDDRRLESLEARATERERQRARPTIAAGELVVHREAAKGVVSAVGVRDACLDAHRTYSTCGVSIGYARRSPGVHASASAHATGKRAQVMMTSSCSRVRSPQARSTAKMAVSRRRSKPIAGTRAQNGPSAS